LAKLVLDRAPCDELLTLDHKRGGEIGAIRWERSRHDVHPFQNMIFVSIQCPHSLPQSLCQPTLELFLKRSTKVKEQVHSCSQRHSSFSVRIIRSVSALPFGLLELVKVC
jgi:hypothetical protein